MYLGQDEAPLPDPTRAELARRLDRIIETMDREDKARRLTLIIAGVGALFAAARLGVIWIPLIKARRARS